MSPEIPNREGWCVGLYRKQHHVRRHRLDEHGFPGVEALGTLHNDMTRQLGRSYLLFHAQWEYGQQAIKSKETKWRMGSRITA